jgi:GDPmannose 4,6-dehydratase
MQHSKPDDFIFATGEVHTVQDVVETAFGAVGLDWRKYVKRDPRFMRPEEPSRLVGNPAKAESILNWKRTTNFKELITEMTLKGLQNTK